MGVSIEPTSWVCFLELVQYVRSLSESFTEILSFLRHLQSGLYSRSTLQIISGPEIEKQPAFSSEDSLLIRLDLCWTTFVLIILSKL
ncbi:hypothetical protein R1flu_002531 [Riccia fluitans]|uniref:Uncharacterized protein n=1 Tax=Riccia fluitans TaxID=41844 RepID=A0ABD1Y6D9_9MARC